MRRRLRGSVASQALTVSALCWPADLRTTRAALRGLTPPTPRRRRPASSGASPTNGSRNQAGHALLYAVIGGVIGHQIGGGTGRDLATAGGAVNGAVIGPRS